MVQEQTPISRRTFLKVAAGTTTAAALAGCGGGNEKPKAVEANPGDAAPAVGSVDQTPKIESKEKLNWADLPQQIAETRQVTDNEAFKFLYENQDQLAGIVDMLKKLETAQASDSQNNANKVAVGRIIVEINKTATNLQYLKDGQASRSFDINEPHLTDEESIALAVDVTSFTHELKSNPGETEDLSHQEVALEVLNEASRVMVAIHILLEASHLQKVQKMVDWDNLNKGEKRTVLAKYYDNAKTQSYPPEADYDGKAMPAQFSDPKTHNSVVNEGYRLPSSVAARKFITGMCGVMVMHKTLEKLTNQDGTARLKAAKIETVSEGSDLGALVIAFDQSELSEEIPLTESEQFMMPVLAMDNAGKWPLDSKHSLMSLLFDLSDIEVLEKYKNQIGSIQYIGAVPLMDQLMSSK